MKNFRGTIVFGLVVGVIGALALREFNKQSQENETKGEKKLIFQGLMATDVSELKVSGNTAFHLKKEGSGWVTVTPVSDDGDDEAIHEALSQMLGLSVEPLDADGEKIDPATYNLDRPASEWALSTPSGERKVAISSMRTYDQGHYLLRDGKSEVLVGDAGWESFAVKSVKDFRGKKLKLGDVDLTRLQLKAHLGSKKTAFELSHQDGKWVAKGAPHLRIDEQTVREFILALKQVKASEVERDDVKAPGQPSGVGFVDMNLEFSAQTKIRVYFTLFKNDTAAFWASNSKRLSVYKVPYAVAQEFVKSVDDFRDKAAPFQFLVTDAKEIEFSKAKGSERQAFKKKADAWSSLTQPEAQVDTAQVQSLLTGLSALKAEGFASGADRPRGLENELTLRDEKGQEFFRLQFGQAKKNQQGAEVYVAKTNLSADFVLVAKSALDDLWNKKFLVEAAPTTTK